MLFWLLYVSLHSLMASVWVKKRIERFLGKYFKYYRPFYSLVAAITLLLLLIYQFSHPSILLFKRWWPLYIISIPLALAGMGVMIVCIRKYFLNLSGIDVFMKKTRTPILEVTGLHSYMRHPLYSGTLLFIWSLFLLFPFLNNLIACIIITLYTLIGISMEEHKLLLEFGDAYRKYSSSIPMLIPFLKRRLPKKKFADT